MKSKVTGNKNWVLKVDHKLKLMDGGRPGHFWNSFFECYLRELARYDWYWFTYKKDYDEARKTFEKQGYRG